MHNVEKWSIILWKSCGVMTAIFVKYVWSFFNNIYGSVNQSLLITRFLSGCSQLWNSSGMPPKLLKLNFFFFFFLPFHLFLFNICFINFQLPSLLASVKEKFKREITTYTTILPLFSCVYLLKVNNRNTRTRCEICSTLTIKTSERRQRRKCGLGWYCKLQNSECVWRHQNDITVVA